MTSNAPGSNRVLGSLRSADGKGIVRMEDHYDTDIDDLWSALTDPRRLARWLGEVEGDLRLGGEFRARFFASEWEGTGRVEACEPPRHLLVLTKDPDEPYELIIEATDGRRRPDQPGPRRTGHAPGLSRRLRGRNPGPCRRSRRPHRRAGTLRRPDAVERAHTCLSGPGGQHQLGM
jgi:Activator of Hsp90 ATPase homolog 1-like protein